MTSYKRPLLTGTDVYGTHVACSTCGFPYLLAAGSDTEIVKVSDGTWQCLRTCYDPVNALDDARIRAASRNYRDTTAVPISAPKPSWR